MSKYTDIPSAVYTNLQLVATSRYFRRHGEAPSHTIGPREIFSLMPDRFEIHWARRGQEAIIAATLDAMLHRLEDLNVLLG